MRWIRRMRKIKLILELYAKSVRNAANAKSKSPIIQKPPTRRIVYRREKLDC